MRLRFSFLPAGLRRTAGNRLALLTRQFIGPSLAALLTAEFAEFDRRRVLPVRLALGQFGVTRGHVHDELGELIEVSGAFAFWHGYSLPQVYSSCYSR
jgi:hypothetical protein